MMNAITYQNYGSPEVLGISEVDKPEPRAGEVLIRVCAAAVSATDSAFRRGDPFFARLFTGLCKPKTAVLGTEFSGQIESVGIGVTNFKVGDEVFAATGDAFGAHAEYVCMSQDDALALKPTNLDHAESAGACEGALTALPFLRDEAVLKPGQAILINGASGSVGTAAVQLAKYYGAKVTGVGSTRNLELMRSLGADSVVDYTNEDFAQANDSYDVIFDTVGKSTFARCKGTLKPGGIYLATVPSFSLIFSILWSSVFGSRRVKIAFTGLRASAKKAKDLVFLRGIIEEGKFRPFIGGRYSLAEAADAHRLVDSGHKRGNVVLEFVEVL